MENYILTESDFSVLVKCENACGDRAVTVPGTDIGELGGNTITVSGDEGMILNCGGAAECFSE